MNKKAFIAGQAIVISLYALSYGCRTPLDAITPQFIDVPLNPYCQIKSYGVEPDEGSKNYNQQQIRQYPTISGATTSNVPLEDIKKTFI